MGMEVLWAEPLLGTLLAPRSRRQLIAFFIRAAVAKREGELDTFLGSQPKGPTWDSYCTSRALSMAGGDRGRALFWVQQRRVGALLGHLTYVVRVRLVDMRQQVAPLDAGGAAALRGALPGLLSSLDAEDADSTTILTIIGSNKRVLIRTVSHLW